MYSTDFYLQNKMKARGNETLSAAHPTALGPEEPVPSKVRIPIQSLFQLAFVGRQTVSELQDRLNNNQLTNYQRIEELHA